MNNKAIIVQARLGSTRLPKKMILKLNGDSVLEFLLKRLQPIASAPEIILATTKLEEDDVLESIAHEMGISVFRGSTDNVLERFYQAAVKFKIDVIVRICGDNIFVETSEISRLLKLQHEHHYDYIANALPDGTPLILTGTGLAVEVFTRQALQDVLSQKLDKYHREHVTPFFYENPKLFRLTFSPTPFEILNDLRLTLDTPADLSNIKQIYQALAPEINLPSITAYLKNNPDLIKCMREISCQQLKGR